MIKKTRKGINASVIFALAMSVLAFVIMGIITSISATIVKGVNDTYSSGTTYANAAAGNATNGLMNVGTQLPLMGTNFHRSDFL